MYGHFFERFGLKPEECYFIDDLPNKIAGAKACGLDGYSFADGDVEKLQRTLNESVLSLFIVRVDCYARAHFASSRPMTVYPCK